MAPVDNLDRNALAADFGAAYGVGLILNNPELLVLAYKSQGYLNARVDPKTGRVVPGQQTKGVEWDANRVSLEIPQTKWYQENDANRREAENARLSDVGSWNSKLNNVLNTLKKQAVTIGADLSGLSDADLAKFASEMLADNYLSIAGTPDGTLPSMVVDKFLAPFIRPTTAGSFQGQAATNAASLRAKARQYGVSFSDQWYLKAIQDLQAGVTTQANLDMEIVNSAKSRYPTVADKINETTSTYQVASTYIQTLADTLEIDPDTITLDTPEIKKAMSYIDPSSGQARLKSLYEFEKELRYDPRWETTRQGRTELSNLGTQLLKDWGFYK